MPIEIILLLLAAAAMHATWNGMIKGAGDGVVMASWVYCGSAVLLAPALFFVPRMPPEGWWLISLHFILHMIYKVLIINMYRLGDFSRVFPVARGIAPIIVMLAAIPTLGEFPQPLAIAGIVTITLGLVVFAVEPGSLQRANMQSFLLATGAGLILSVYTIVDALGVRLENAGLTYFIYLFVGDGIGMAMLGLWWRGSALLPAMGRCWIAGLAGAVMSIANFGIVLWVMTFTAIGLVAAVRETSIVIAALIGVVFFQEGLGPRRILAAVIVLAGVMLLNLVD